VNDGRDGALAGALAEALRPLLAELVDRAVEERLAVRATRWLTIEEAAQQRRTTPGAMRARCERGQVPGAVRDGRRWLVPSLEVAATPVSVLRNRTSRGERRANGPAPGTGGLSSHA
jgi:hypothetical protein